MDVWHYSSWGHLTIIIGNIPPYSPTITGPNSGEPGVSLTYNFKSIDYDGDDLYYYVDWGDGTNTGWFGSYPANTTVTKTHSWNSKGDYNITAKAKDALGRESGWSEPYHVRIGNQPPEAPIITGPTHGKIGILYNYTITAIDPEGDNVSYFIDWGDDTNTSWNDWNYSGLALTFSHIWAKRTYVIKAKVKDVYGLESDWATLEVIIPRAYTPLISQFLERFFYSFSILKLLIRL
jgi:hypothetical protein